MLHLVQPIGTHREVEWAGVEACPRVAARAHVQEHAAAAPHICLGAAALCFHHLGGHVCLCAFHIYTHTHQHTHINTQMAKDKVIFIT